MADKTVRYTPLQEAATHTEVRQNPNSRHSLYPITPRFERLLPMSIQGCLGPRETVSGRLTP